MSIYTIDDVPADIKNLHLKGALHIVVLHASRMVETGDEALDIANARKDKNHIDYYFDIDCRELERCPGARNTRDGKLEIKVRAYAGQSNSALTSFSFRLIGEPTVGGFLDTFSNRSMFPFHFQKFGFACILPFWVCHFIRAHYTCFST